MSEARLVATKSEVSRVQVFRCRCLVGWVREAGLENKPLERQE